MKGFCVCEVLYVLWVVHQHIYQVPRIKQQNLYVLCSFWFLELSSIWLTVPMCKGVENNLPVVCMQLQHRRTMMNCLGRCWLGHCVRSHCDPFHGCTMEDYVAGGWCSSEVVHLQFCLRIVLHMDEWLMEYLGVGFLGVMEETMRFILTWLVV